MKELIDKIQSDFDENYGWIRIVDADWIAYDLSLSISIQYGDDNSSELWKIECAGVVEERITSECAEALKVLQSSPLLKPFQEVTVDVVFSENKMDSSKLLGIVFSLCFEAFGRSEYIERFMNMKPISSGICSAPYGLLGRFPESVADQILKELSQQPIKVRKLAGHTPKFWNGTEHLAYPSLELLEIGNSYIVAECFSAIRA